MVLVYSNYYVSFLERKEFENSIESRVARWTSTLRTLVLTSSSTLAPLVSANILSYFSIIDTVKPKPLPILTQI